MVEHDLKIAKQVGDEVLILRDGESKGAFSSSAIDDRLLDDLFLR
jgi:hypothetical protein